MTLPTSQKPIVHPTLYDVLQNFKTDIFRSMNCIKPGIIQSFNPTTRTVVVQIVFKQQMVDGTVISYPVLLDCPVITIQGGGGALTFPILTGDECLLFFADRNIDAWFKNGGQSVPFDARTHHLSDGFALVGLNSLANALKVTVTPGEVALAFGTAKVGEMGGKITIANQAQNLKTILTTLFTALASDPGLSAGSHTALTTANTSLGALLY